MIDRGAIAIAMAQGGSFEMRSRMGWKTDQDKAYPAKMLSERAQLQVSRLISNHWQSAFVQHAG